jgi:uncharacterized RDD family membrane protein YckC
MEQTALSYAGFWKRFLAALIDGALLGIVCFIPVMGIIGLGAAGEDSEASAGLLAAAIGASSLIFLAAGVAAWLYFTLMESSVRGATLGKMALGIRVTDMSGNKISFGRATGRYFGKMVSGMILYIGFIMAGFTQQKQALHDIMAGCLVVNK